jgi:CBS-domain-containing membrane protein
MQSSPTAVQNHAKLREVIDLMSSRHVQAVLVVDEQHRFIGEISALQLAKILLPHNASSFIGDLPTTTADETVEDLVARLSPYLDRPVTDFVDHDIPTVHPTTPLTEALLLLRGGALRMPVTEGPDDTLVGAVSVLTVLRKVVLSSAK